MVSIIWGCQEEALNLKIRYDHLMGLKKNDRVIFENNHIGTVKKVTHSKPGTYIVDIAIIKNFAENATEHSQFYIIEDPQKKERMAVEMVHTMAGGKPLTDHSMVEGATKTSAFFDRLLGDFAQGFGQLQKEVERLFKNLGSIPESNEFKKLAEELKRLKNEMAASGEEIKEKIREELLPRLEKEVEALRKKLRELGREDELKPLEEEMGEIKRL
jgi:hypothetical protein